MNRPCHSFGHDIRYNVTEAQAGYNLKQRIPSCIPGNRAIVASEGQPVADMGEVFCGLVDILFPFSIVIIGICP